MQISWVVAHHVVVVVHSIFLLETERWLVCFILLVCRKFGENNFDIVVDTASRILSIGSRSVVRSVVYMFLAYPG